MVDLVSKKSFRYARRDLVAGDRFEASNSDARLLVAIRRAELATPKKPRKQKVVIEVPESTEVQEVETYQEVEPYQTTSMKAED